MVYHFYIFKIDENLSRFQFFKNQQNCSNVNYSVNFKDIKKVDHILESSLDFQSFFFEALHVIYQLSENIKMKMILTETLKLVYRDLMLLYYSLSHAEIHTKPENRLQ